MLYKSNNLYINVTRNKLLIGEYDFNMRQVAEFSDEHAMYIFELFLWKFLGGSGNAPEDRIMLL